MTATCSFARGPVNSAFHEAVKISFLMSDIRSLSTYLTCPAWWSWLGPGWVHLDDEFVYFPASVLEVPSGTRHSSRYQQLSSPPFQPYPSCNSTKISQTCATNQC